MGRKIYSKAFEDYVRSIACGRTNKEITAMTNEHFKDQGIELTFSQMSAYRKNHKIPNGRHGGTGELLKYTPEFISWLEKTIPGRSLKETAELATELYGNQFGEITQSMVKGLAARYKFKTGRDTRFYKGQESPNKGKPMPPEVWEKIKATTFQKGMRPHNWVPVGTIRRTSGDRYLKKKIAEPNVWEFLHKLVWEEANGPIPEGMLITFLDGNHENCSLENLRLVSPAVCLGLTRNNMRFENGELTALAVDAVELECKASEIKKKLKEKNKNE